MKADRPKICVVGSSNIDLVVKAKRLPLPGETIPGGKFLMVPGGKTLMLNPNQQQISKALLNKHYLRKHGEDAYYGQEQK
jgi:hypothetical protein